MSGESPSLYEEVLAAAGAPLASLAPSRPRRDSAAVVLWRENAAGELEVYWQRRAAALPFMGGWQAFPGGALEKRDAAILLFGTPAGADPTRRTPNAPRSLSGELALPATPDLAPGVVAGALRELFEESGVLLARRAGGEIASASDLPATDASLGDRLAAAGLCLDASRLRFAGRWLTPPFAPMRFDNRFFLAEWREEDGEPSWSAPESEAGEWIRPAAAVELWRRAELLAAPPVLHLMRVLAEEGAATDGRRLLDTGEADLGPLRRIELVPGVVLFPLASATLPPASTTNCFLLGTGDSVLVDPGSGDEAELSRLLAALAAANRQLGRRVVAIWLTHHHPDHVAGVERMRRELGVPVAAHPATIERLARRGLSIDTALSGGATVQLAGDPRFEIEVLHTPGHTRGHLVFRLPAHGAVIAGDLLSGLGTVVIDPPEGDMDEYLESLERMERIGQGQQMTPGILFPAHGAPLAGGARRLAELRAHRLERERQVLAAWAAGIRSIAALVGEVYPEVAPMLHPLAGRQIRAHLDRLERAGRLSDV